MLNFILSLSSISTQHTCTVCIIDLSASLTENTACRNNNNNNNKSGVTLLVVMATVVCLRSVITPKGRNPMPNPFRVHRFRLYLAHILKIFRILRPKFEVSVQFSEELWLLQAHRHTFFHYLGVLTRQLNSHQRVSTTTPKAQTKGQKES